MSRYDEVKQELTANPKVWAVTGAAGFIGSNLLETLLKLDQHVIGLDNFATGNPSNLDEVRALVTQTQWNRFRFIEGDICSLGDCRKVCEGAHHVLHQAALGSVPRSLADPIATNAANITGFLNMLVAARESSVRSFVYATSSSVYGDNSSVPKLEENIGNSLSPYATTKLVNELYARVFTQCYAFNSIGLRYFNVFGPRQDPKGAYAAVIPKWISAMIEDDEIVIYGDGETSRDFCFVDNVVQANILSATTIDENSINQIYNVGVGDQISLNHLFEKLRHLLMPYFQRLNNLHPVYKEFRVGDVRHSCAGIEKSKNLLQFEPTHVFSDGLVITVRRMLERSRVLIE